MARVFTLKIKALGDEADVPRRLRNTLKTMLRRDRLRCLSIEEDRSRDGIPVHHEVGEKHDYGTD
jgi:hypothetical protein